MLDGGTQCMVLSATIDNPSNAEAIEGTLESAAAYVGARR